MREDWAEIELGEVCDYSKGKKPIVLKKGYSETTPYPYVNIKAFEKGIFEEFTDGKKCNLCEEGDLLMVWDGARAGYTGKAKKGAIGSTLMKIEPKDGIEKNYIFYFLLSLYKKLNTNPRGVGIPHVEPRLLWASKIIIPAKPIQRAIVTKIENLFTSLDKGIADLKKAQQQLKVYRQAVLKKAFEGELTREWREKHIKTDGRPSHILIAADPTKMYNNKGMNKMPEGWEMVKLSDISEHITDGDHQAPPKSKDGIPFITISNIDKSNLKSAKKLSTIAAKTLCKSILHNV